jgi:predicted nuclease of predicted toxin-antitoxin system
VLAKAQGEARILLTFDKDFGELARAASLGSDCGIVLVRITAQPGPAAAASLADVVLSRTDWVGHFSVIEPGRIRMRALG